MKRRRFLSLICSTNDLSSFSVVISNSNKKLKFEYPIPKSSRAILNPSANKSLIIVILLALVFITVRSVISIFIFSGGTSYFPHVSSNLSLKSFWNNSTGETLIESVPNSSPRSIQLRAVFIVSCNNQRPVFTIYPFSSATGINSAGETKPNLLLFQRNRTSNPVIILSTTFNCG